MPYGSALYPGATTYPDTTTYPGQGPEFEVLPELQVLVSFEDLNQPAAWEDVTSLVREFRFSRGRDNELEETPAGTCTIRFDNKTRRFIPGIGAALYPSAATYPSAGIEDTGTFPGAGGAAPMNRVWAKEFFNGISRTLFYGYAENYSFDWEFMNEMATLNGADEFLYLSHVELGKFDPPVDTYADVIKSDQPAFYNQLNTHSGWLYEQSEVGPDMFWGSGNSADISTGGAILGEVPTPAVAADLLAGYELFSEASNPGTTFDLDGLGEITLEIWLYVVDDATPAADHLLMTLPATTVPNTPGGITLTTAGKLQGRFRNSANTLFTVTSTTVVTEGRWYHVVATITGGFARIYVNGVQENTSAFTGSFAGVSTTPPLPTCTLGSSSNTSHLRLDDVVFYRQGLSATRIAAHYMAATARGFNRQDTGTRVAVVMNAAGSQLNRVFPSGFGVRTMAERFMRGQDALSALREVPVTEGGESMLFVGNDPLSTSLTAEPFKLVFIDQSRSGYPYNAIQATFADPSVTAADGGLLINYLSLERDYSDAFLFNDWTVADVRGGSAHDEDAESIARYGRRSRTYNLQLLSPPLIGDEIRRYATPMERVTAITVDTSVAAATDVLFGLEVGDYVRVVYTPSGIDQRSFIQKIEWSGQNDWRPWTCRLSVSPL